jgi:hypothetical protein
MAPAAFTSAPGTWVTAIPTLPLHKVAPADDQLRLETMDKAGIDLAVLSVTTPGVQAESDAKVIE